MLIDRDGDERSMLLVSKVLLLFHLDSHADSKGAECIFQQYMEYTPAQDAVDNERGYGYLM